MFEGQGEAEALNRGFTLCGKVPRFAPCEQSVLRSS